MLNEKLPWLKYHYSDICSYCISLKNTLVIECKAIESEHKIDKLCISFRCSSDVGYSRQAVQAAHYGTLVYWLVTTKMALKSLTLYSLQRKPIVAQGKFGVWGYVCWGMGFINLGFFFFFSFFLRIGVWFEITGQDSLICISWGRCKKLLERRCIKWSHFPGASAEVALWFHNLWVQQHYTTQQRTLLYNTTLDRSTSIL